MTNINRINTENLTPYNHQKSFGGRDLERYELGRCGNASANGDFLPSFHNSRGYRLSSKGRF